VGLVVLVEGRSDQAALEALGERRGGGLGRGALCVLAMGGATNVGRYLDLLGPRGIGVRVAGLCDAGEEGHFRRALERAGLGVCASRADMEALGFYVCTADLEDELIRAVGPAAVEQIIRAQGELRSFRTFQKQPAHQQESAAEQLHRFMGTRSGRKSQYARLLAGELDLTRVPRPLDRVLAGPPECRRGPARPASGCGNATAPGTGGRSAPPATSTSRCTGGPGQTCPDGGCVG